LVVDVGDKRSHESRCGLTKEAGEAAIRETRAAFPDWHERVVDMVIEGDRAVTRYVSTGTHQGLYKGVPPTGAAIEIDEISIYRIEGNRVAEQWCLVDDLTLLRQLGG
jgi:predicted ester cyclase